MFDGAPEEFENVTLCVTFSNTKVTVAPLATVSVDGLKVLPDVAVTVFDEAGGEPEPGVPDVGGGPDGPGPAGVPPPPPAVALPVSDEAGGEPEPGVPDVGVVPYGPVPASLPPPPPHAATASVTARPTPARIFMRSSSRFRSEYDGYSTYK